MEGFKKLPKMQHFKTGGSVQSYTKREKKHDAAEIKQDKSIVKKAIGMHDKQEHPGEKTDLSKLKKGGRAKKSVGSVKKYQCGGKVKKMAEGGDAAYTGDDPIVKYRLGIKDTPAETKPSESTIEDESGRGNVTAAQQAFNQEIPGSGMNTTPKAAPTVRRRAAAAPSAATTAKPGILDRIKKWATTPSKYTSVANGNAMKKGGKACKK